MEDMSNKIVYLEKELLISRTCIQKLRDDENNQIKYVKHLEDKNLDKNKTLKKDIVADDQHLQNLTTKIASKEFFK
jgi:hypothetical protein